MEFIKTTEKSFERIHKEIENLENGVTDLKRQVSDLKVESIETNEKDVKLYLKDVAKHINRKLSTVYVLISKGKLKTHSDGKFRWMWKSEVDAYLQEMDSRKADKINFVKKIIGASND